MKITQSIPAEDVAVGDYLFEGQVTSVQDNYESTECVDIYVDSEDEPLVYRCDDIVEIYLDRA